MYKNSIHISGRNSQNRVFLGKKFEQNPFRENEDGRWGAEILLSHFICRVHPNDTSSMSPLGPFRALRTSPRIPRKNFCIFIKLHVWTVCWTWFFHWETFYWLTQIRIERMSCDSRIWVRNQLMSHHNIRTKGRNWVKLKINFHRL